MPGTFSPAFLFVGGFVRELSVFIDESGSDGLKDKYYLVTLVLHEQSDGLSEGIRLYEQSLSEKGLPDIPFHASPLLNGHDDYTGMELAERKRLLSAFRVFFRHMPVKYTCIALKTKEHPATDEISNTMRRRLVDFLFDELPYFQGFDAVKIYYDNGQQSIAEGVHKAVDYGSNGNGREVLRIVDAIQEGHSQGDPRKACLTWVIAILQTTCCAINNAGE